jgi:hypothetical protein
VTPTEGEGATRRPASRVASRSQSEATKPTTASGSASPNHVNAVGFDGIDITAVAGPRESSTAVGTSPQGHHRRSVPSIESNSTITAIETATSSSGADRNCSCGRLGHPVRIAFLEAMVNELYQNVVEGYDRFGATARLPEPARARMLELWERTRWPSRANA